jgi:G:T/U-mismatch repair DNA glycosylase
LGDELRRDRLAAGVIMASVLRLQVKPETCILQAEIDCMIQIKHLSLNYKLQPDTETLIIGTFNPDAPGNSADFFYGRKQNYFWKLLPLAFGENDLRTGSRESKINFIRKHKIDFIDLIDEVLVEEGMETNYNDDYLDSRISKWKNVIEEMKNLKHLKRVCFTRKTLSGIPNIRKKISEIEKYSNSMNIRFRYLITPSRVYTNAKQAEWNRFLK